jgi:uncharacterized membrane protein YcaP (DUF421 family)
LKIDWSAMLFGDEEPHFLFEVMIRSAVMFGIVLLAMLLLGKRGVKQLSVFELVIILTLGSAAGDPIFYQEVGLLTCIGVFGAVIMLYRVTIFAINKSTRLQHMVKGKPVYLIQDGRFIRKHFDSESITFEEFFEELRLCNVSQLGQIQTAILETSGNISLIYYPDDEVKPGLPVLPHLLKGKTAHVAARDFFACSRCAAVEELDAGTHSCKHCECHDWVPVSCMKRIS